MANTVVNPSIGKIYCPMKDCPEVGDVREFKLKTESKHKNRYGGKRYVVCPVHGTIGRDGNEALQKYIEENINDATLPKKQPIKKPQNPKPTPTPTPTPKPKPVPENKSDDSWSIL